LRAQKPLNGVQKVVSSNLTAPTTPFLSKTSPSPNNDKGLLKRASKTL